MLIKTEFKIKTTVMLTPYYQLPFLDLFHADCMDIMKQYPDKYFDLAIVDPPYGINVNISIGRRKGDKKSNYHKFFGNDSSIPDLDYFEQLFRISENQIIWGGQFMTKFLNPSPCWLLWDKGFSEDVTFARFEMAWTSFKSTTKKYDFNAAKNNSRIHPTQKPVDLYRWILQRYVTEGMKLLDTHFGSGSIALAVDKANRLDKMNLHLTACEIDLDYCQSAVKRISESIKQGTLSFES
jgi:site-specific DNA-methyltransferase (adenine-specific)